MMTPMECKDTWNEVCRCYKETIGENRPKATLEAILASLGMEKTREVFATVSAIKKHDGRIYGENRKYMESIPVNPDAVVCVHENPMRCAGLDEIHTSHINQLITELRKVDNQAKKENK